MKNADTSFANRYHQATKHSEISIRTSAHYLDWANKPSQFKTYDGLPSVSLPRDVSVPESDALNSIIGSVSKSEKRDIDIRDISELLFFSAGLTRRLGHGRETHYMRAASATGALYPIELYIVSGDISGLRAGVYHFNPLDFALTRLRLGDYRAELASISDKIVDHTALTLVFTSLAWRNSWKYQARSYRHWFWDSGVIVANLLAVSNAMRLSVRLIAGFVDDGVNELLGLENNREAAILLSSLGPEEQLLEGKILRTISRIQPKVRSYSKSEVEYPEIWTLHKASSLTRLEEVNSWRNDGKIPRSPRKSTGPLFKLDPVTNRDAKNKNLGAVILQRGSARRFARTPISFSQLSSIIRNTTGPLPLDYHHDSGSLINVYLIANSVEKLRSGSYAFHAEEGGLEQLRSGELRRTSAYLCLEQPLFGDASAVFFLMTPLEEVLSSFGNRGYRAAQLEGGIIAGRIYLSAYSLGLGASGSTFYDDAVTEFFSPQGQKDSTVIAVGVGVPPYAARTGRILPQFLNNETTNSH